MGKWWFGWEEGSQPRIFLYHSPWIFHMENGKFSQTCGACLPVVRIKNPAVLSPYKLMRFHLLELHLPCAKVPVLLSKTALTPALDRGIVLVLKCHQWNPGQKRLLRLSCNCPLHLLKWPLLDAVKGSSLTFVPSATSLETTTGDEQEDGEASGRTFLGLRAAVAFQAGVVRCG